jgi:hypothetical protein
MFENMLRKIDHINVIISTPEVDPVKMNLPLPADYLIGRDLNLFVNSTTLRIESSGEFKITILDLEDGMIFNERTNQIQTQPLSN